jgi:hypothetical protein
VLGIVTPSTKEKTMANLNITGMRKPILIAVVLALSFVFLACSKGFVWSDKNYSVTFPKEHRCKDGTNFKAFYDGNVNKEKKNFITGCEPGGPKDYSVLYKETNVRVREDYERETSPTGICYIAYAAGFDSASLTNEQCKKVQYKGMNAFEETAEHDDLSVGAGGAITRTKEYYRALYLFDKNFERAYKLQAHSNKIEDLTSEEANAFFNSLTVSN